RRVISESAAGFEGVILELIDERCLAGHEPVLRVREREPRRAVDFGERDLPPRAARPFDRERVAADRGGVDAAFDGEELNGFAAALLHGRERHEVTVDAEAGFFVKFAPGDCERIVPRVMLALWECPG